ncbi:MAG TPA: PilN domain-containing protein, partial [bacterium]|nr:PilN domain-containing protein [bacterium]
MRIVLNLIPERVLRERDARSRRRALFGIPLIGLAVVVILYVLIVLQEGQSQIAARNAEQSLAPLRSPALRVQQMQQEAETLERQRDELAAVLRQRRQWSNLMVEVGRVIPQDAWLTTMTLDASTMTLSGFALRLRAVASFTQSLAFIPNVASVQLQSLQEAG